LKETLPPNQREGNYKARARLATALFLESRRGNLEHSESEPDAATYKGNLAKSGKAQKLDIVSSV